MEPTERSALSTRLRAELQHLLRPRSSSRPWEMPLGAALASGLPLMLGVYLGHLDWGLVATLGGLVFLYCPDTPLHHRMVTLMACAFGLIASYALGLLGHLLPGLLVPVLAFISILVTMVCRFYALGPPGSLFFVMAASIGAFTPAPAALLPQQVGLLALGCLLAFLIAFFYSLYMVRRQAPRAVQTLPPASFDFVIFEPVIIGVFVGLALAIAQLVQLERPYWVAVSCVAVIQGATLREVWTRQVHRITGTAAGLLLAWVLLVPALGPWGIALLVTALTFVIEILVVRHYGLAVVFITPLTIFLAEAAHLGAGATQPLLQARLLDTVLGSVAGLLGGLCLHQPGFRRVAGGLLRRLTPARLRA